MRYKARIDLVYSKREVLENGSPEYVEVTRPCDAFIEDLFSAYYYQNNNRMMRLALNVSIPHGYLFDYDGSNLDKVVFKGVEYKIKNILHHKKTTFLNILDCEQIV